MTTVRTDIRPSLPARSFDRILLIKPSSLGDVIHALPVLDGLRTRFPAATIDWLIASAFAPLLEGHPLISGVIPFDRRRYGRMAKSPGASADFLRFAADLRRRRYDLVIDLQGLFRSGFLAWCTRAPVRIGFHDAREAARLFYTHRIRPPHADMHAVNKNFLIADPLGFAAHPIRFPLELAAHSIEQVDRLLSQPNGHNPLPLIVIAPGARWETKLWPADRFAATIRELTAFPARCILVGGKEESALCDAIAASCPTPPLNLAGQTTLQELSALIARADAILCHDSAVAHLAAAFDRPLVCITGPTNPKRTGPYDRPQDVLRLDIPCSPCYFRKLAQCPHDHRCMRELCVGDVVTALRNRLNGLINS